MTFEIKLPLFEGPFDLLLFFIKRDELDIYDIPIAQITKDFLDYTHALEKLDMEVASEFIVVAATLMSIKAKMLLPRPELDEEGEEVDPREDLVSHLLQYRQYKSVMPDWMYLETQRLKRYARGNIGQELKTLAQITHVEAELQNLDLFNILKAYQKVMKRYAIEQSETEHQVVPYPYTILGQKTEILDRLSGLKSMSFSEIIQLNSDKIAIIFNFLAILELLQAQSIHLTLGEGFNNFWIEKNTTQTPDE